MNANLMTKKIEMSKNEAKAAGKIGTPEFEELKNYMAMYIILHTAPENEAEAVAEFDEMVLISKCHGKALRYPTIKKWFLAKYPEVAKFGTLETAEEAQEEETKNQSVIPMPESQTETKTA